MPWKHLSLPLFVLALASCSPPPPSFQHHISKTAETEDQGDGDATPDQDKTDTDSEDKDTSKDQESMPDPTKDMETPMAMEVPKDDEPEVPPFDPCPEAGKTCLIMPLGDSITWGIRGYNNGGYRVPLFKIVAQLVPSRNTAGEARVQDYNAATPSLIQERAEKGLHIIGVDMHSAITANDKWKTEYYNDDLHPKEAGFDVMANVWWEAISKYLK